MPVACVCVLIVSPESIMVNFVEGSCPVRTVFVSANIEGSVWAVRFNVC